MPQEEGLNHSLVSESCPMPKKCENQCMILFQWPPALKKKDEPSSGLKTDHAHIINDKGHLTMTLSQYT